MKCCVFLFIIICNSIDAIAQVIENPVFNRADQPSLHIDKVKVTTDTTFVYCTYTAAANSWANISSDTYLLSYPSKEKHKLLSCSGFPIYPEKRIFQFGEKCKIIFSFPSIKGETHFDFIEMPNDKVFNIYGVSLSHKFMTQYLESELKRFSNMSSFYDSSGDTLKAINYKKNEIEANKYIYGIKSESYLTSLLGLCIMYDKYGLFKEAIEPIELVSKLHAELYGTSDWQYALQLRTQAQFYSNAKMYDLSIKTFKESIALYEQLNISDDQYVLALNFISNDYESLGDEAQSIQYQQKAILARRNIDDSDKYLEQLVMMEIQGNSKERTDIVEHELCVLPEFVDTTSFAFINLLKSLITHFEINNEYSKALRYCDRSISILENNKEENILRIAEAQGYKCRYLRRLGFCEDAIELGERAKSIFDSLQIKSQVYGNILEDLSWCYGMFYNYEKAILYQKQNLKYFEEKRDWLSMAGVYNSIANYYHSTEDLDNAEVYIKKAIELLDNHSDAREYIVSEVERTGNYNIDNPSVLASINQLIFYTKANLLQELARIYEKEGKMSEAISKEKELGELLLNIGDEQGCAIHLLTLSGYYLKDKQYVNAINTVEQSLQIYKNQGNLDVSMHNYILALIYMEQNDIEKAIQYAEKSVLNSKELKKQDIRFASQPILSHLYWKSGNYRDAEKNMSEILDVLQDTIRNDISGMTSEQKQRMWNVFEPYFYFYRNIIEKSDKDDKLISKLYNYILFSKSLLLDSEKTNKDKKLARLSVTWENIQQKLSDKDIVIEFISTTGDSIYSTYHALIIDKNSESPHMITLYQEAYLEKTKQTSPQSIIDIVGNLIWEPILKQYKNVENIYFSPDGVLNVLPIEYYKVDGIEEMMEHYNLYRLSSTKEIVFNHNVPSKNNAILYGGLDYDMLAKESSNNTEGKEYSLLRSINARGGFDPLISTFEEVNEICNLLKNKMVPTTLYTGVDGTEDSFKNLSGKDVKMLHISTHGMYVGPNLVEQKKKELNFDFMELITNEKDPVREDIVLTHSFLVMSGGNKLSHRKKVGSVMNDGILTAFEISKTDLSKVDLVVLSACETGLGDIDNGGVYGLQRGFKKAGANTILMSLDKVDDEATKILMVEFYKNQMNGKNKYQSLKDAQKHLRQVENGKYDKPEYWASFIMLDGLN